MTPDDLKWREARREHIATAIYAAMVAHGGATVRAAFVIEVADELIAALDKRAAQERARNDSA